jgi:hypothetical protein
MVKRDIHLFEINSECRHRYLELLKDGRFWNGSGQYWLGHQCDVIATKLLHGDVSALHETVKSENLFRKTK